MVSIIIVSGELAEMEVRPVVLEGKIIRLEPLKEAHVPDLAACGQDENIWRYMLYGNIETEAQMRDWVRMLLQLQAVGTDLPFAVVLRGKNRAIGATRYLEIEPEHRKLEIGGTWYGVDYQGSGVNPEAKYLLLRHAFENLGCVRVQLKTDARNIHSQRAIERLGAVKEGILRQHMITPEGYRRDSVYYSILDREWPEVKIRLEGLLDRLRD